MNLKNIVYLLTGAAVGSVVTWAAVRAKYERLAKEEIESVVEVYSRKYSTLPESEPEAEEEEPETTDEEVEDYKAKIQELGYSKEDDNKMSTNNRPYTISPEEFGEDYDTTSLTYYADGVLVDEDGDPIPDCDIDELVGLDNLETFGMYEDDSVFVRDDINKLDIEILRDEANYYDMEE